MEAFVLVRIRDGGRSEEREAQHIALASIAIYNAQTALSALASAIKPSTVLTFAVVKQGDSVAPFRQISVFVADDFEFSTVPRGVTCGRTLAESELVLISGKF